MNPAPLALNATDSGLPAGIETAYEPIPGSIRLSQEGRRVVVRYVAIDPWPPTRFFPENGTRGRFDTTPSEGALPLARDGARLRKAASGDEIVKWWAPPRHYDEQQAQDLLGKVIEGYAAWQAGELCGCVTETFTKAGRGHSHDISVEWSHLSASQAQLELDAKIEPEPSVAPSP